MATLITKKNSTVGVVPNTTQIEVGELAVNTADGKLYTKHTDDIQLGAAPIPEEETRKSGIITFLSEKGYGFITEDRSKENVFFHQNNAREILKKGHKVSFEKERSAKGFSAINIELVK